ncbi:MAG TPA: amino acid permease [Marmoricola sp.]|nr:amino acid permease [Marmoricola sp.]
MSAFTDALKSRPALLFAFAFAVMADPVSSVAYAIEAPLRALNGDLNLLFPAMAAVIVVVTIVIINYQQIIARYPNGGGAAAAAGEAFGEAWAFIPIGALVVDYVLTIAISVAAGSAAIIAYFPNLGSLRLPIAIGLLLVVGGLTWFGHLGRLVFAVLTVAFIAVSIAVLIGGASHAPQPIGATHGNPGHSAPLAVILAFPVAMALSTGIEAPSSAIAQLGQVDADARRRFGQITLWLTLGIVGVLTLGMTLEAVHIGVGIPKADSTMVADLAQRASSSGVFAAFQAATALLLLSAASSSFQAGPGLFKALATKHHGELSILPVPLSSTNKHHTPVLGVVVFTVLAAVVTAAAGGDDQKLVLFYAVSVFMSFLAGLLAMCVFSARARHRGSLALNVLGAVVVVFTLAVNLARVTPLASLAAALGVAGLLYWLWVRAGRPRGIRNIAAEAENPDLVLATDH